MWFRISHIRILSIGLELACNRGSCGEISLEIFALEKIPLPGPLLQGSPSPIVGIRIWSIWNRKFTFCIIFYQLVVGNSNRNSVATRTLSPRIEARYIRISPQYWHGWPCMRTELYGCSSDTGNVKRPTPGPKIAVTLG